ncbi:MAG TPA: NRDE family protein [Myxococcota bacterium]|nr:NRDE family protein [Myxococcota bacterium]
MCTLIALHRCYPSAHLLVAANRDEFLARPASGPRVHEWHGRRVIAPIDERAGGTWLGLNDAGVFAALTNRPTPYVDPARRSRGLLVADALGHSSATRAAEAALRLAPRAYNPFNLFVADADHAFAIVYQEKPRVRALEAGVHVIGNADPNDAAVPKIARLQHEVGRIAAGREADALDALSELCRSHVGGREGAPLERTCIHAGEYGTRSSTLLRLGPAHEHDVLRFAGGAPCETAYEDLSPLLRSLD